VERIVALILPDYCEGKGILYSGQYRSMENLSLVDAVGMLMTMA
jgi:hypothetical protein